jgi:Amt family ammonium transporter
MHMRGTSALVRSIGPAWPGLFAFLFVLSLPSAAAAQGTPPPPAINAGDTAWMLTSTALVLLMTPALAFFYGGLVRSKNALNTMMMSFISLGFVSVAWALLGYSLALGPGSPYISAGCRWPS